MNTTTKGNMINLGDKVEDTISGFTGVVIGRSEFLHGCIRCGVQPTKLKSDGGINETQWFDEPQLKVIKPGFVKAGRRDTGGPVPSVPKRQQPPK